MPWQLRWPPYVPQRVVDDRRRAADDLDQSSGDLKETIARATRVERVTGRLGEARERNHFSEGMESLFASHISRKTHQPKEAP